MNNLDSNIIYFPKEQIREIHQKTIEYSGGGSTEIIDLGKLEAVIEHIQNDDYYPTFVDKITHLFFSICKFHAFVDGNKRLAITLSLNFLLINSYLFATKNFMYNTENISYHVAAGNINKELLHEILEAIIYDNWDENEELKLKYLHAIAH